LTRPQAWFYGEGLELPVKPSYDTTLAVPAYNLAARWDTSRSILDVSELDFTVSDVTTFNANQMGEVSKVSMAVLNFLQSYNL
jgi:leukotriene-A4 hydrolase